MILYVLSVNRGEKANYNNTIVIITGGATTSQLPFHLCQLQSVLGLSSSLGCRWLDLAIELRLHSVSFNLEEASLTLGPLPPEHTLFTYLCITQHQFVLKYSTCFSIMGTTSCGYCGKPQPSTSWERSSATFTSLSMMIC